MAKSAKNDLTKILKKITDSFKDAVNPRTLKDLANEAIRLIVVRTRLGYGVKRELGSRAKLKSLSDRYVSYRLKNPRKLSTLTTARRSNLTFSGQMLDSMKVIRSQRGQVVIGPSGRRNDGHNNADIARWVTEQGRPFNNLSELEFNQLLRFYRRQFGDLLKNERLTFKPSK